jgi:hypothetical protein
MKDAYAYFGPGGGSQFEGNLIPKTLNPKNPKTLKPFPFPRLF